MMFAQRQNPTAADLMRLLAVWLAAILLVQGLAAGLALGTGPLHRHGSTAAHVSDHHHHNAAERHHHRADDASVMQQAQADVDAASLALVAALALMAFSVLRLALAAQRPVWAVSTSMPWHSAVPAPPRKPPRVR